MADLIRDDPSWWYLGFAGPATRRLRVWRLQPGRLVAVVTERPDDAGTSITNAAEMVAAQLAAEHPGETIEIVEHWTANPALDGPLGAEHFDGVAVVGGSPTWWPIPTAGLAARLGPHLLAGEAGR